MIAPPRWWVGRAARLSASLVACALEAQGREALRRRAQTPAYWAQLAAALGYGSLTPEQVARVLARGLGAAGRSAAGFGDASDLQALSAPPDLRLLTGRREVVRQPSDDSTFTARDEIAARLGAHRRASARAQVLTLPAALRVPGLGGRATFALSLLSEFVFDSPPAPLLSFALGDCSGTPYGVPLRVYDGVLSALSVWLGAGPRGGRGGPLGPLEALFVAARRLEGVPFAGDWQKRCDEEHRHARDYATFTHAGPQIPGMLPPRMPRLRRPPALPRWEPPAHPEAAALADLFLP